MLIFEPKGDKLKEFCFHEIWFYEGEVKLLYNESIKNKIKLVSLKKSIKNKIEKIENGLYNENCFDYLTLLSKIRNKKITEWDTLLNNIILHYLVWYSKQEFEISNNDESIFNITSIFTKEIKERYYQNLELLNLINQKKELEIQMDLLTAEVCSKNKKGQYKTIR